jgi:hypothetical protein
MAEGFGGVGLEVRDSKDLGFGVLKIGLLGIPGLQEFHVAHSMVE